MGFIHLQCDDLPKSPIVGSRLEGGCGPLPQHCPAQEKLLNTPKNLKLSKLYLGTMLL